MPATLYMALLLALLVLVLAGVVLSAHRRREREQREHLRAIREREEKLRLAFQNASYEGFGSVTCSFGVTEFHPEDSRLSLLARADAAMYKAKDWGRNQVMTENLD